ncbi:hypothetical protein, partial [Bellilinea sp.]|uniref:hypothetical protein n=1 Tax=Bellilinea sp. TaxID=2838785 RepID=UPI002ADE654B
LITLSLKQNKSGCPGRPCFAEGGKIISGGLFQIISYPLHAYLTSVKITKICLPKRIVLKKQQPAKRNCWLHFRNQSGSGTINFKPW